MLSGQTQIEYMILGAMEKIAPDVVSAYWSKCRTGNKLKFYNYKERLLQELMDARGPVALLELSEYFSEKALSSPLIYVLLNSPDPLAMMNKMMQYERHLTPSTCRLSLLDSGEEYIVAEKVAAPASQPLIATELFFCGAIKTLLKLLGCEGVQVEWVSVRSEQLLQVLTSMDVPVPDVKKNTRWRFSWSDYRRREQILGLDEFLISNAEPFTISCNVSVTHQVEEMLASDLASRPDMQDVAERMGMSVRTFQRKLSDEGVTYSRIYNNLRIKTASRLLRQTNANITEISFISGFSDSAHFSREFKKVQKMTPLAYRDTYKVKD